MFRVGDIVVPKESAIYGITNKRNRWIGKIIDIQKNHWTGRESFIATTISCKTCRVGEKFYDLDINDFELDYTEKLKEYINSLGQR